MESIAAAVETTPSSSARVEETVSHVSFAIKAPCVSPGISARANNYPFTKHCRSKLCEEDGGNRQDRRSDGSEVAVKKLSGMVRTRQCEYAFGVW